jgi:hypothetical protein
MSLKFTIPKRIEAWFKLSPNVKMQLDNSISETHRDIISPDRGIVIGGRSTSSSPSNYNTIFHEMGHMIDIDDCRVRMPGWGLKYGKWVKHQTRYSFGFYEMQTDEAVRCEIRVMAIQAAITEHCGFIFDYIDWASLLSCGALQNYCLWRDNLGLTFDDEHDNRGKGDVPSTTTVIDAGIIRSMREELSIEAIWAEWVRKTKVVDRQVKRASISISR